LDLQRRMRTPRFAHAGREMLRAAVAQVVAIHRGDHDVAQAHVADGVREAQRLQRIGRFRPAVRDVAERTAARADFAQDHEGRGALGETLVDVRARGFLAHRHQRIGAQLRLQLLHGVAWRQPHADPRRLAQRRRTGFELRAVARDLVLARELLAGDDGRDADGIGGRIAHARARRSMEGSAESAGLTGGKTGSALRGARSNWWQSSCTSAFPTSASDDVPPKSITCVTCRPAYPQGLMRSNGSRSMATLKARPWKLQPRRTRRPSAAILASPTYTPGAPSRRAATMFQCASVSVMACSMRRTSSRTPTPRRRRSSSG